MSPRVPEGNLKLITALSTSPISLIWRTNVIQVENICDSYFREHCIGINPDFSWKLSNDPSHDVNVMDAAVMEKATGSLEVGNRRKRRVATQELDLLDLSNFS
jgi:hypothetical protein